MKPTEICPIPEGVRKKQKLSILMPFLNESTIIVRNTREVLRIMKELDYNFEVVLIDDGSKDGSFQLLEKEFRGNPRVRLARNFQNFGKGWALKTGYEFSAGDFILFLDSDLELSPYHIPGFFRLMLDNNADAVVGSKLHKGSNIKYPLLRKIYSIVFYTVVRILFGLPIMDSQTGIKLFKREALEVSLPKVMVKRWAFDIELLLLLFKNGKKIVPAPVELQFSRENFGNIKLKAIARMFFDTLAIFYRDRFLRFYDRPLGRNVKYFYSFVLFPEKYDAYEKECLKRFLGINYDRYEVIVAGNKTFNLKDRKLRHVKTSRTTNIGKMGQAVKKGRLKGDIIVISSLSAYPDERFLFTTGRLFSQEDCGSAGGIGGAGGFVVLENQYTPFEAIAINVLQSVFLNLDMVYRYKPVNYKKVNELQFDGFFIKREIFQKVDFEKYEKADLKLEYILSKQIQLDRYRLVYSPDIMLYRRFPRNSRELYEYVKKGTQDRAGQIRSRDYRGAKNWSDWKFLLALGLLAFIAASIITAVAARIAWFAAPLAVYYLFLLIGRVLIFGPVKGVRIFYYLSVSQVLYGYGFFKALLFSGKK